MTHSIINNREPQVLATLMIGPEVNVTTPPGSAEPDFKGPVNSGGNITTPPGSTEPEIKGPVSPEESLTNYDIETPPPPPRWVQSNINPRTTRVTRTIGPNRLGTRPKNVGRTALTRYHFRSAAYPVYAAIPHEITDLKSKTKFKKWIKRFQKSKNYIPKTTQKCIPQNSRI